MAKEKKEKDFSNPKKLGFMRFLMIWWFMGITLSIVVMGFSMKQEMPLNQPDNVWSFFTIVFDAISIWLVMRRKAATRKYICFGAAFNIVVGTIMYFTGYYFSLGGWILSVAGYVLIALYFTVSRRAKAVLVQPLDMHTRAEGLEREVSFFQPKTWAFWRNLIMYFCIFSVVGHWMEAGYCLFIKYGIIPGKYDPNSQIWSDWLFPFCVYGVGAVCCVLLFYPVKLFFQHKFKRGIAPLVLSFIVNACVCTLIELIMGLMLNQPDANGVYPLWDYTNMFCNFMGQICLQNAVAFGFAATLMTWVIYPTLEHQLALAPNDVAQGLFIAVVVLFLLLFFLYCVNFRDPAMRALGIDDTGSASETVRRIRVVVGSLFRS